MVRENLSSIQVISLLISVFCSFDARLVMRCFFFFVVSVAHISLARAQDAAKDNIATLSGKHTKHVCI